MTIHLLFLKTFNYPVSLFIAEFGKNLLETIGFKILEGFRKILIIWMR